MPILPEPINAQYLIWAVALFILKQLIADFLLQTNWMAKGKEHPTRWMAPLAAHVALHALGTLAISLWLAPHLAWLALVDFGVHGLIDRGKSLAQHKLQLSASQAPYWWLFGIDQTLHNLTHLAFAVMIAGSSGF